MIRVSWGGWSFDRAGGGVMHRWGWSVEVLDEIYVQTDRPSILALEAVWVVRVRQTYDTPAELEQGLGLAVAMARAAREAAAALDRVEARLLAEACSAVGA